MKKEFISNVKQDFLNNNSISTEILTEKDIAHLPELVKNYLRYTKSLGKQRIKNFKAEFIGGIRSKPEDNYMQLNSIQYNFYEKPSRYFYMVAKTMGIPATGLHIYKEARATFKVKFLDLFIVVDAQGEKMNQAETVTLLNDMCFIAPATLIDKRITWEQINKSSVRAVYRNQDILVSATLEFNNKGELVNFISNDRYHTDGKIYENYPWSTPVQEYKERKGYRLPTKAKLIYQKADGDFVYGELEYKDFSYNLETLDE